MKEHLNEIIKACAQHGWNLKYMDLVFIGGGFFIKSDDK